MPCCVRNQPLKLVHAGLSLKSYGVESVLFDRFSILNVLSWIAELLYALISRKAQYQTAWLSLKVHSRTILLLEILVDLLEGPCLFLGRLFHSS